MYGYNQIIFFIPDANLTSINHLLTINFVFRNPNIEVTEIKHTLIFTELLHHILINSVYNLRLRFAKFINILPRAPSHGEYNSRQLANGID